MQLSRALRVASGDVLTFTGAGGKTTALRLLAAELAAVGLRVLITTTTRFGLQQLGDFPAHLVAPSPAQLSRALSWGQPVVVVREIDSQQGKAIGFAPDAIADFRFYADVLLVEGDGSQQRPLKAPAPHEPVIPAVSTHVVCCAGLWALGHPLQADTVHRPQIMAQLLGLSPGSPLTPAILARLLQHPAGPARGGPPAARRYLLLNGLDQVPAGDAVSGLNTVRRLAVRLAAHPAFNAVCLAQLQHQPPVVARYGKISAIVLAAGASTRFGSPKQLALWRGQPMLRQGVMQALAADVNEVIVVLGAHFLQTAPILQGLPVKIVYQPHWEQGQSASMQAGLRACMPLTQAAFFFLGDQPTLPSGLSSRMITSYRQNMAPIVAPRHQGRRGNPVLFDQSLFSALQNIRGDQGGRALFARFADEIAWVEAGPEILMDVDYPQDM